MQIGSSRCSDDLHLGYAQLVQYGLFVGPCSEVSDGGTGVDCPSGSTVPGLDHSFESTNGSENYGFRKYASTGDIPVAISNKAK